LKIVDKQKTKAAMQPTSLKRKEKDDDDSDFSDNGDGTGSEVKSDEEDDEELQATLIASIAEKQRQLDKQEQI
jgi:hypothetical protein